VQASAADASLDPEDRTGLREQAHHMLDDMLGYIKTMRAFPTQVFWAGFRAAEQP
jgi:hypothetical protein